MRTTGVRQGGGPLWRKLMKMSMMAMDFHLLQRVRAWLLSSPLHWLYAGLWLDQFSRWILSGWKCAVLYEVARYYKKSCCDFYIQSCLSYTLGRCVNLARWVAVASLDYIYTDWSTPSSIHNNKYHAYSSNHPPVLVALYFFLCKLQHIQGEIHTRHYGFL